MRNASRDWEQLDFRRRAQIIVVLDLIRALRSPEKRNRTLAMDTLKEGSIPGILAAPICVVFGPRRERKRLVHHFVSALDTVDFTQHTRKELRGLCSLLQDIYRKLPVERGLRRRKAVLARSFAVVHAAGLEQQRLEDEAEELRKRSQQYIDERLDEWIERMKQDPDDCLRLVSDFANDLPTYYKLRIAALAFISRDAECLLKKGENRNFFFEGICDVPIEQREDAEVSAIVSALVQLVLCTPESERPQWKEELLPFAEALIAGRPSGAFEQGMNYIHTLLD
jgi:hypothetical protein